jgi:hypothetical protein
MDQQIAVGITELEAQAETIRAQIARRSSSRGGASSGWSDSLQVKLDDIVAKQKQLAEIGEELERVQTEQYDLRQELNAQRRSAATAAITDAQKRLFANQREIVRLTEQATALLYDETTVKTAQTRTTRGAATTGLVATIHPQMAQVPIAYCHLLNASSHPLVRCQVRNTSDRQRRIRVITYIEGYTAQDIASFELEVKETMESSYLPTFFPGKILKIRELTRATLNVLIEDLDSKKVEIHQTQPIWLLARNSAPLAVRNPDTNEWSDLSQYLGAFVTPHQADVEAFLGEVVAEEYTQKLSGYQSGVVTSQVEAIYKALQKRKMRYVGSIVDFAPEQGASTQRVRLPRETLKLGQANCIDGTLLFASLLESMGINPALVIVPGHAFVGWSTAKPAGLPGSENQDDNGWDYLETTYLGTDHDFGEARKTGQERARSAIAAQRQAEADPARQGERWFQRWSLRELRARYNITPME